MNLASIQLVLLRVIIGALFLSITIDKYHEGWLTTADPLRTSLTEYRESATSVQAVYLDNVAIPYAGVWARLILLGEGFLAVSLILGLLVRFSTVMGILMILNFHAANGNMFAWKFFGTPWGGLLLTGLFILLLARAGRTAGFDALLAKSNSKSIFW